MGNGTSSEININLDRSNSLYYSGELVSGTIGLNIIEGIVKTEEIYIKLTGKIGYTTRRSVSNGRGRTTTQTEYHHVPFYSTKTVFARPEVGEKELVFGQGQYSWRFQIPLTDYLPPTLNQPGSYPHVRYYLQVVIDKPWYKPNKRETKYLRVFPRVNLLQNPQCLVSTIFGNRNRKDITLKGTLNKLGYVPGELIVVTLEIENPRRVLIQHINVLMLQSYQIGRNSREYSILKTTLPTILNLNDEHIKQTFSVIIPTTVLPPSYKFRGGIKTTAYVDIHYLLKFTVRVEGMFTNFDVDVPITLGTEPNPDQNQQQAFNPLIVSYSSNPEQTMFSDDLPPSYDSVVQNEN